MSESSTYSFNMMTYSVAALTARLLCQDNPHLVPLYRDVLGKTKRRLIEKARLEADAGCESVVTAMRMNNASEEEIQKFRDFSTEKSLAEYIAMLDEYEASITKELGLDEHD
jgi:hypothetical protein